jgi:regulator of protease activity HflC (stomatin/prohibitin superfamily)
MWSLWIALIILVLLALAFLAVKVVKQYEPGVLFRLGKVIAVRQAGLTVIIPFVDVLNRVSLRIVTMPIQSQGIITRDNVSVDKTAPSCSRPR